MGWGRVRVFGGIRQKGARFPYKNKSLSNFGVSHHITIDKNKNKNLIFRPKKNEERTAATRIPAWSPTAVLTSRYRA